jgi:hypothetical protein
MARTSAIPNNIYTPTRHIGPPPNQWVRTQAAQQPTAKEGHPHSRKGTTAYQPQDNPPDVALVDGP